MFLESCSTPAAAPEPVAGWYEGTLYEDKPFYITKNAISWTSGRKRADFGRWTAVSVYDPSIRMQAEGGRFSITPGYGWDGAILLSFDYQSIRMLRKGEAPAEKARKTVV